MPKRKKIIRAGRQVRAAIYSAPMPNDQPHIRAAKVKASTAARQRINYKQANQKLEDLLACNFDTGDIVATLTYRDADLPADRDGAVRIIKTWLRKLRSVRRANGAELRYIYVTECKHERGRYHHHIVLNGCGDVDHIRKLWKWGGVETEPLDIYGYEALAKYLTKESVEGKRVGARMWSQSLGLKRPEVETKWCGDEESIAPPPGVIVLANEQQYTEFGGYTFIKYLIPVYRPRKVRPPRRKKTE